MICKKNTLDKYENKASEKSFPVQSFLLYVKPIDEWKPQNIKGIEVNEFHKRKDSCYIAVTFSWIIYLAFIGVVQFICLYAYITERWFDIPVISFIVSIFIAYIPIVGTIFGYIGATEIFNWSTVFSVLVILRLFNLYDYLFHNFSLQREKNTFLSVSENSFFIPSKLYQFN